jgi:hypothetical protein
MFVKKLLLSLAIIALATPAIARATSGPPIVDIHMKKGEYCWFKKFPLLCLRLLNLTFGMRACRVHGT